VGAVCTTGAVYLDGVAGSGAAVPTDAVAQSAAEHLVRQPACVHRHLRAGGGGERGNLSTEPGRGSDPLLAFAGPLGAGAPGA